MWEERKKSDAFSSAPQEVGKGDWEGWKAGKDIAKAKEKPNQDEALGHALCRNTTC